MMELRDVLGSNILSSSSLATHNRIQNGIPLLLIPFGKQGNSFRRLSNNVNNHPDFLLQSVQYSDYSEHQPEFYHHVNNPISEIVQPLDSVSSTKSWLELSFHTFFAAVITSVGVLVAIVWIFSWLRNKFWKRGDLSLQALKKGHSVQKQLIEMNKNKDAILEVTNMNKCLQITVTDTQPQTTTIEDEINDIKKQKKSSNSHLNDCQLETGSSANNKSQLSPSSQFKTCREKRSQLYQSHRKQKLLAEDTFCTDEIPANNKEICKKRDSAGEFSVSKERNDECCIQTGQDVITKASKNETKLNDYNPVNNKKLAGKYFEPSVDEWCGDLVLLDFETEYERNMQENVYKYSLLPLEENKGSPNNSDTSSSFTFMPPLTPSSVSSSVILSAVNITPTTIMTSFGSTCDAKQQFTFSPKMVNEYSAENVNDNKAKCGNSYYRFPEVDTFTPSSNQNDMSTSMKTSQVYPCSSSTETSIMNQPKPSVMTESLPQIVDQHNTVDNSISTTGQSGYHTHKNVFLSDRTSRRVRLKSISLDSEGARLIEENLSTSIPVEELVEIAANQSHYSSLDNQTQPPSHHKIMSSIDESNTKSCKNRNILNLKLNLNDKDKTLTIDEEYRLNDFFFEYYDYEDEEDTECKDKLSHSTGFNEKHPNQFSQRLIPKTPTLNITRKKANSLDSDQYLSYLSPQTTQAYYDTEKGEHQLVVHSTTSSTASFRASSLSVPTTPKRQIHRLSHQQLALGKTKQNCGINDKNSTNNPSTDRHLLSGFKHKLSSFDEKAYIYINQRVTDDDHTSNAIRSTSNDQNMSNTNLKTLPEVSSLCNFTDRHQKAITIDNLALQNLNKSRSSILQRRGSNHSLTLNLETPSTLNKGLSASNFSLGNRKESYLNLVSSSNNLHHQQSDQKSHQQQSSVIQTKKNLLQRRGSNTSLVLNLQGSTNSLNRYNSHNSLNIQNQFTNRPLKKGLIERRNSNTSLTLFNVQNPALSVSNCNLPGSICSLNSMVTYQTQNEGLMLEEDEHQVSSNNNQSNYCVRVDSNTASESHLSINCVQHGSRRKFLSSDSIHNIARSRAVCCCQQEENCIENLRISHNRASNGSCFSKSTRETE